MAKQRSYARGVFEIHNAHTEPGESWYIVGSTAELGKWDACRGLRMNPVGFNHWKCEAFIYTMWSKDVQWKAVRRNHSKCQRVGFKGCETHGSQWWEPGNNNHVEAHDGFYGCVDIKGKEEEAHREAARKHSEAEEAKNIYITFEVHNGLASSGMGYYVVGNKPELGEWDLNRAIKLHCVAYPTWRAEGIRLYDSYGQDVDWKVVRMSEDRDHSTAFYQPGFNNTFKVTDRVVNTSVDLQLAIENEMSHLRGRVHALECKLAGIKSGDVDVDDEDIATPASGAPVRCPVCKYSFRS